MSDVYDAKRNTQPFEPPPPSSPRAPRPARRIAMQALREQDRRICGW
jgi:hypothetical protein